jgi:hypothetical protein
VNHIGGSNKMVSETPISDSTAHNVADLGMLCRRLERELNAANDHIKRLEAAGDAMERLLPDGSICDKVANLWHKAKEAKP